MKNLLVLSLFICTILGLNSCGSIDCNLDSNFEESVVDSQIDISTGGETQEYVGYIYSYKTYSYKSSSFVGNIWVYIPELASDAFSGCAVTYEDYDEYFKWVSKLGEKVKVCCKTLEDGTTLYRLEEYSE